MTADPPSFVADVAAQVVAWHNRHPLARRISRKDVQGIGIVVLPFAREGKPRWDAPQAKRGLLALMFPPRQRRRQWPLFSEDLVPEIGTQRLVKFVQRHGQDKRPGPADLPERVAAFDRDLLDEGGADAEFPPEQLNRYLVTAAIDIGPTRPRLMLGAGKRPAVLGQRLWSLPRMAALGGGLLLAMVISAAGLWIKAMPQRGAAAAAKAAAAASAAHKPASATPTAVHAVAPASAAPHASAGSSADASAHGHAPEPSPAAASAPHAAPAQDPHGASTSSMPAAPGASAATAGHAPAAAASASPAASAAAPAGPATLPMASSRPPTILRRASQPLVPRLKPDLAASALAESPPRASAPATEPAAPATPKGQPGAPPAQLPPDTPTPRAAPPAPPAAQHFYALVTRPVRSKAEAEAMLKRLRTETDRIAHPTATQTALQESRDGWRATWWPFTNPRQAENARAALARRIELEVIDF